MKRRQFLLESARAAAGCCALPLAACSPREPSRGATATGTTLQPLFAHLEKQIPTWLEHANVPGLSMAVIEGAKLVWRGAFGFRDLVSQALVDHDTVFEAGSVSKTVFAYAVMKLRDKGVIDLDAPLTKYMPEPFLDGDPRLDLITARHVLSHTTGFQNWRSRQEALTIHFTPGARFGYSGEGYHYLQSVMTRLAGRTDAADCATFEDGLQACATDFDAYMKAQLLVPFGMTSSGYVWIDAYDTRMARGHRLDGKQLDRKATARDAARYGAAGGLHTTASDYSRFLIEVVAPAEEDSFRLSDASRLEMIKPQVKVTGSMSWALGWQVQHKASGDVLSHGGDNPGFKALTAASIEKKSGFVILTNSDRGFDVIRRIVSTAGMQEFLPVALE
jgi:CubicO group peptidase (beta-lactamase class C family)